MGVSPRRLEGWEPATVTTLVRDAKGLVLSEVTVVEPEFNRADLARLLAARRGRDAPRGSHGYLLSESTDPEKAKQMTVGKPTQDFYAAKLHAAQKKYQTTYGDTVDMDSLLWGMVPKDDPDALPSR